MDEKKNNFVKPEEINFKTPEISPAHYLDQDNQPFSSRFKSWIRAVALLIVMVFIPDQISWAFNYNPQVLWGEKLGKGANVLAVDPNASKDEVVSKQIATSINHLLEQVAYKEHTKIQLQLPQLKDEGEGSQGRSLVIDPKTVITRNRIRQFTEWLVKPEIHPLNCGIYALKDILVNYNIHVSLEELSVSSLAVDILSDIIRPGEAKLKTSLYAINRVANGYGLNFKSIKIDPKDVVKLPTPFVANFDSEHFVYVFAIDDKKVLYNDIGRQAAVTKEEFIKQINGYVLAPDVEKIKSTVPFEYVPEDMQAFIWGNRSEEAHV